MNPDAPSHDSDAAPSLDTIEAIAARVGTPFYLYRADEIRRRIAEVTDLADAPLLQARYAMKACSARPVLSEVLKNGMWIDAVSGNEVLRALRAGFDAGSQPPVVLYTSDVFRDNALEVIVENGILPNVGSEHMIAELSLAGYRGGIGFRVNPGFGHGFVKECDTGGPSSKHGIWFEELDRVHELARTADFPVRVLHSHIGTGPAIAEFQTNAGRLVDFFVEHIAGFHEVEAISLGGGFPHPYRPDAPRIDLGACKKVLIDGQRRLSETAGRPIRVEIEPGRYMVAGGGSLITRVRGLKATRDNDKGPGQKFIMVDAGFCDLVRPTMYGSYHHIEILGREGDLEPRVLAGPMCESGDIFTRDANELVDPRLLPRPEIWDLVAIHDAGAYGAAMSSNYNSLGRVPQVWFDDGRSHLVSRRETLDDILRTECFEAL